MNLNYLHPEDIKLTVIENEKDKEGNYFEIRVSRSFFNSVIVNFFLSNRKKDNIDVNLTPREKEVLMLVAEGKSNGKIAENLFISVHTAKRHVCNIIEKLNAKDRTNAAIKAIKYNMIDVFSDLSEDKNDEK